MSVLRFLFDASADDWIRFALFFAGIVIFIAIAEKTRSALGWSAEVNRKLVHIMTGVLIFFSPYLFTSDRPLIWMAVVFMVVNGMGIKSGKLKGMHGTDRTSYGTVFYPLTFLILVLTCWADHKAVLMSAILILAISDAMAAIVGENLKSPHEYTLVRDKKSLEGSAAMFLTTFIVVLLLLPLLPIRFFSPEESRIGWLTAAWIAANTAIAATALEALSSSGSDNLSAPLGSALMIHFMLNQPVLMQIQMTAGLGLGLLVAVLAFKTHFLTASGSVGTFLLAALIYGLGGYAWVIPILVFFVASSLLSRLGKVHKSQFKGMFEKSSCRDLGQVLANGSVAGLSVLGYHFYQHPAWYAAYLGAVAAVTADTWATELGVFSRDNPRSIITFKPVPPGTSGGVSIPGTISAFLGSGLIVSVGTLLNPVSLKLGFGTRLFWLIVLSGLAASLIDSLLGATVQAQYTCTVCGKQTEKRIHCEAETAGLSGIHWINNDWVNLFCASCGAIFAGIICLGL